MQAAAATRSPPRPPAGGRPVVATTASPPCRRPLVPSPSPLRAAAADADAVTTTTTTIAATATATATTTVLDLWTLSGKDQLHRATATAPPVPADLDTPLLSPLDAADQRPSSSSPAFEHGSIELITGPMFSGKSTALLTRAAALTAEGRSVVLVKPERDTRYAQNLLVTHAGKAARCLRVPRLEDLPRALGRERWAQLDVVVVDEGQFFDDLIEFAVAASEGLSDGDDNDEIAERSATTTTVRPKAVIVAGLSGDFRRRPFGRVAELLPLADSVRALRARCFSCGGQAPFSLRLCGEAAQVLVGGPEAYRPACRACFSRHQQSSKKEAP